MTVRSINPKWDNPRKRAPVSAAKIREGVHNKAGNTTDVQYYAENAIIFQIAIRMPFGLWLSR